jgi:hypothetical protein
MDVFFETSDQTLLHFVFLMSGDSNFRTPSTALGKDFRRAVI